MYTKKTRESVRARIMDKLKSSIKYCDSVGWFFKKEGRWVFDGRNPRRVPNIIGETVLSLYPGNLGEHSSLMYYESLVANRSVQREAKTTQGIVVSENNLTLNIK